MKILKPAVSLAIAGLIVSSNALAMPGFTQQARSAALRFVSRKFRTRRTIRTQDVFGTKSIQKSAGLAVTRSRSTLRCSAQTTRN